MRPIDRIRDKPPRDQERLLREWGASRQEAKAVVSALQHVRARQIAYARRKTSPHAGDAG